MKRPKFLFLCLLIFWLVIDLQSGVVRDDVKPKKCISLANEAQFNCVGKIMEGENMIGSCVLLSDRWVITSARILMEKAVRVDTVNVDGVDITIQESKVTRTKAISSLKILIGETEYLCDKIILHPNYLEKVYKGKYFNLAMIKLTLPVKNVIPLPINKEENELGTEVFLAGYGACGKASDLSSITVFNQLNAGTNLIDSVGGWPIKGKYSLMYITMTDPKNQEAVLKATPMEFLPTPLDEGGGAFRKLSNGNWEVTAINTGLPLIYSSIASAGYIDQKAEYTRLMLFTDWIQYVFNSE